MKNYLEKLGTLIRSFTERERESGIKREICNRMWAAATILSAIEPL